MQRIRLRIRPPRSRARHTVGNRGPANTAKLSWRCGVDAEFCVVTSGRRSDRARGVRMKAEAFSELMTSVRQGGRIARGEARAFRRTSYRPADVKAIRALLEQTQEDFAAMIGVSVATLRNWEQGRLTPEGPALALLRVAAAEPRAVARALRGKPASTGRGAA